MLQKMRWMDISGIGSGAIVAEDDLTFRENQESAQRFGSFQRHFMRIGKRNSAGIHTHKESASLRFSREQAFHFFAPDAIVT